MAGGIGPAFTFALEELVRDPHGIQLAIELQDDPERYGNAVRNLQDIERRFASGVHHPGEPEKRLASGAEG